MNINKPTIAYVDPSGHMSLGGLMSGINVRGVLSSNAVSGLTRGGSAAARVLGISSSSSSTVAGGMAIANRLGVQYFKALVKRCKKGKSDLCNFAQGYVKATAATHALVAITPKKLKRKLKITTVVGAFDYKKGTGVADFNGDSKGASKILKNHARRMGLSFGETYTGANTSTTVGRCAEFRAANKLIRQRSQIKNIRWTTSYHVRTEGDGSVLANEKNYCDTCCRAFGLTN